MKTAILVTRENIVCSELTKEQFVAMMMEDLKNAPIKSEEIFRPELEAEFYNKQKRHLEYIEQRAWEFANRKWKTEKRRTQYVNEMIAKEQVKTYDFSPVSFFDFKLNPFSNGISDNCILRVNTTEEKLGRCFDEIKNNKYWVTATGWQLIEERNFRSQIKLIMPDEMNELYRKEEEGLANAIANFYAGSNYWGD